MSQLHSGKSEAWEISSNRWAGIGLVRGNAGVAIVGNHDLVADEMLEHRELGRETFLCSGYSDIYSYKTNLRL